MQTLEHISQVQYSTKSFLWPTRNPDRQQSRVWRTEPLRSEASQKHLSSKASQSEAWFRIRQNNVNTTHTRDQKTCAVPPHTLNLKTTLESLLLSFKQLPGPESTINRRHSVAWFCHQIWGLFSRGNFLSFFLFSFFFFFFFTNTNKTWKTLPQKNLTVQQKSLAVF